MYPFDSSLFSDQELAALMTAAGRRRLRYAIAVRRYGRLASTLSNADLIALARSLGINLDYGMGDYFTLTRPAIFVSDTYRRPGTTIAEALTRHAAIVYACHNPSR